MKINYLAYFNFGFGFISFLTGIIPCVFFFSILSSLIVDNSQISFISESYLKWISDIDFIYGIILSCFFILLGFSTYIIGLFASILINDKLQRGIAFLGNILGLFGVIGNLINLVVILVPKS